MIVIRSIAGRISSVRRFLSQEHHIRGQRRNIGLFSLFQTCKAEKMEAEPGRKRLYHLQRLSLFARRNPRSATRYAHGLLLMRCSCGCHFCSCRFGSSSRNIHPTMVHFFLLISLLFLFVEILTGKELVFLVDYWWRRWCQQW